MTGNMPLSQASAEDLTRIIIEAAERGEEAIFMTRKERDAMVMQIVRRAVTIPLLVIAVLAVLGGSVWLSGLAGC